jgi:glycosyltransferase involved in cell wall biosynthesis
MSVGRIGQRMRAAVRYGRQYGLRALIHLVDRKIRQGGGPLGKIRLIESYSFVRPNPVGAPLTHDQVASNTVNWVMPPFGRGSGGHLNIFRFIHHLERMGFECRVVIVGEPRPFSAEQAAREINDWFFPLNASVHVGMDNAPPAHVCVATAWQTAYAVRDFKSTNHRCYFVQDFEPCFYAAGSEYALAEETYRFGFTGITAGGWLKEKLANEYGMVTHAIGFSYDHERYRPMPRRDPDVRRLLFYARPPTPRRGFELGVLVLHEVTRRLPDVKVVCAGWDVAAYGMPFEYVNAGVVELDDLPDLYSQCDVALVLSFSNLSLVPIELMACGTPVVSNAGPWNEWLLNSDNARLARPTIEDLTRAVVDLLEDPAERRRLSAAGIATAKGTDWRKEADRVAHVLRQLDRNTKPLRQQLQTQ